MLAGRYGQREAVEQRGGDRLGPRTLVSFTPRFCCQHGGRVLHIFDSNVNPRLAGRRRDGGQRHAALAAQLARCWQRLQVVGHHLDATVNVNEAVKVKVEADARTQNGERHHEAAHQQREREPLRTVQVDARPRDARKHTNEQESEHDTVGNATVGRLARPVNRLLVDGVDARAFGHLGPVDVHRLQVVQNVLDVLVGSVERVFTLVRRRAAVATKRKRQQAQHQKARAENAAQVRVAVEQVAARNEDGQHVVEKKGLDLEEQPVEVPGELDELARNVPQVELRVLLLVPFEQRVDNVCAHVRFKPRHQVGINVREDSVQHLEHEEDANDDRENPVRRVELGRLDGLKELTVKMGDGDAFECQTTQDNDVHCQNGLVLANKRLEQCEHVERQLE